MGLMDCVVCGSLETDASLPHPGYLCADHRINFLRFAFENYEISTYEVIAMDHVEDLLPRLLEGFHWRDAWLSFIYSHHSDNECYAESDE